MKILTFFLFISFVSCSASDGLDKTLSEIAACGENICKTEHIELFKLFPDNFDKLEAALNSSSVSDSYPLLIKSFFKSKKFIEDRDFVEKVVKVSIGGKYIPDGVEMFQHYLMISFEKNSGEYYKVLQKLPDDEIKSFFHFYFDAIHPEIKWTKFPTYLEKLANTNSRIYLIALSEYEEEKSESDTH